MFFLLTALVSPALAADECPNADQAVLSAAMELALNRLTGAEVGLSQVRQSLGCADQIPPQTLARYFQLEGVLYRRKMVAPDISDADRTQFQHDSDVAFAAAKRIAPDDWNPDLGKGKDYEAFQAAEGESGGAVEVQLTNLMSGEWVSLDGAPATAPLQVRPGFHTLQVGPPEAPARFGRVFEAHSGAAIRIDLPLAGPVDDWRSAGSVTVAVAPAELDFGLPKVDLSACEPTGASQIGELLRRAETEVMWERPDVAEDLATQLAERLPCLEQPVRFSQFTRFARLQAYVSVARGLTREAALWAVAAEKRGADLPWHPALGPDHAVRTVLSDTDAPDLDGPPGASLNAPAKGGVFASGLPLSVPVGMTDVPALLQVTDRRGHVVAAHWQIGGDFPLTLVGPPAPPLDPPAFYQPEDARAAAAEMQRWYASMDPDAEVSADPGFDNGHADGRATAALMVLGGMGRGSQSVDNPGVIGQYELSGAAVGLASWGAIPAGSIAPAWDVAVPFQDGSIAGTSAFGGVEIGSKLRPMVGVGATSVTVDERGKQHTAFVVQPHLGLHGNAELGKLTAGFGIAGGWTLSATHGRARAVLMGGGSVGWLAGLEANVVRATFVDEAIDGRNVAINRSRAGLCVGVSLR